jgi:hypothetical protein
MNFYVQKKKWGSVPSPFLPRFSIPNSKLCMYMYGGIDGCLEERSDFMDLTQKKKKKARVYTLIFVFDQVSIPWQLWVLNPLAACMQDFAKIF